MSLRNKLDKIAQQTELFPELTNSQKEANRLLVLIANAICARRKEMKQTQTQLTQLLSVSQPMVCQWENGEYNFTIETLTNIFDKLKMEINISFVPVSEKEVIPETSRYDVKMTTADLSYQEVACKILEEAA